MSKTLRPVLYWFRKDLRLADHPGLEEARRTGAPVVPVFVWAPEEEAPWAPGAASRWWLHHSLRSLAEQLREVGSRLIVRRGPSLETLLELARETGAGRVISSRCYEPASIARDTGIKEALRASGIEPASVNASLLREPWEIRNRSGGPFQVFTPYWRACLAGGDPGEPIPAPTRLEPPTAWPDSEPIEALDLLPRIAWDAGLREAWRPGEAGALAAIRGFAEGPVFEYATRRDRPDLPGTSRLSPHLHFGEIGPRQAWHVVKGSAERSGLTREHWREGRFLTEIGWREFAYHLLFHFPHTTDRPLRKDFDGFPWRTSPEAMAAWSRGRTGIPLVDAGMRELWTTGWMHNRVRMVVGSFLVKNLLLSWRDGARWFWDTLVDADLASNTLGWQWVGGCGADAAPYFRVFNPVTQGLKFDPEGSYVSRWVPELRGMPATRVHAPWAAPSEILARAGVVLGRTYPEPIVSLSASRVAALAAYESVRGGKTGRSSGIRGRG